MVDIPDSAGLSGYVDELFVASDGHLYVTSGNSYDTLAIIKYNENGNVVWQHVYGYMGTPFGKSFAYPATAELSDGDIVVSANDYTTSPHRQWVLRIDANGALLWATPIPLATALPEGGEKIAVDDADGIIFQTSQHQIVKLDAAGNILWTTLPPAGDRFITKMQMQPDGDVFALGTDYDTLPSGATYPINTLLRISTTGVVASVALPLDSISPLYTALTSEGNYVLSLQDVSGIPKDILRMYREDLSLAHVDTIWQFEHDLHRRLVPGTEGDLYVVVDYPMGLMHYDSTLSLLWDVPATPPGLNVAYWMDVKVDASNVPYARGLYYPMAGPGYLREALSSLDPATGAMTGHTFIVENLGLPISFRHFEANANGVFWDLMEDVDDLYVLSRFCASDCPPNNVTGAVWIDADADCVQDSLELALPGMLVETTPHHFMATSDALGEYSILLWPDTHTVMVNVPPYRYVSCAGAPYEVIVTDSSSHPNLDFGIASYPGITDMVALAGCGVARPGFDHNIWCNATNVGTMTATGRLRLDYDPMFTYDGASPAPDSVLPSSLVWNYSTLAEFDHLNLNVELKLPAPTVIGTPYRHVFHAYTSVADTTPANNSDTLNRIVVGSYDPNAKYFRDRGASASLGVATDSLLWFEIYFQNTGTDTAFTVLVKDTLEADLDWGKATTWITSHPATFTMSGHGIAEWLFDNILLPDSNTNEPASHGYILFSVPVRAPIVIGKTITNSASIYFDYNVPVLTNTAIGTYDGLTSITPVQGETYTVFPNPFAGSLHVRGTSDCGYQLCDLTGRMLQHGSLQLLGGEEGSVSTMGLATGVYLLRLTSPQGEVSTFKVVKAAE